MRNALLALAVILATAAAASAQTTPPVLRQFSVRVAVSDGDGMTRAEVDAAPAPNATNWPLAIIIARALKTGVNPTVPEFRIRAWEEAAGARVHVFAATPSGRSGEVREERIASVLAPIDRFVEIAATEKYNARRITVTAYREPVKQLRFYQFETPHIDIPVRPWTPPQR